MNTALAAHLFDIVACSESMLRHAEAGAWPELVEMETQRRALIETVVGLAADADECAELARVIRRILDLDRQTIALSAAGRDRLIGQLRTLSIGRNALSAYRQSR